MANPVLLADLEARWRPLADSEKSNAQALLDDAWAIANAQVPLLNSSLDGGNVSPEVVRAVVSAMVIRVLRNPDGVRTWSVDDYSQTRDNSVSAGALYLSPDELALIGASIGQRRRRAFSIAPGGGEVHHSRGAEWPHDYGCGYLPGNYRS